MKRNFINNYKAFSNKKRSKKKYKKQEQNNLKKPLASFLKKKRVGRGIGSKVGKTSGRGMKGQKARNNVKKGFEGGQIPIHRRLPKFGFTSHKKNNFFILNVGQLQKIDFQDKHLTKEVLFAKKLIPNQSIKVKLLGTGSIDKSYNISLNAFSDTAIKKIKEAGGSFTLIE